MSDLLPQLEILPKPQLKLWTEIDTTPSHFTLYGGTALALHLGHRISVDFDFFSNQAFDPDQLLATVPYLDSAEVVQVAPNTLTCRVDRKGMVLVSFFGGLNLGQIAPHQMTQDQKLSIASLLDIAGTKIAVIQKRAEVKDYLDLDALMQNGLNLPTILACGKAVYGTSFNPLNALKALSYFEDVALLNKEIQSRLATAVQAVDLNNLPSLNPIKPKSV